MNKSTVWTCECSREFTAKIGLTSHRRACVKKSIAMAQAVRQTPIVKAEFGEIYCEIKSEESSVEPAMEEEVK